MTFDNRGRGRSDLEPLIFNQRIIGPNSAVPPSGVPTGDDIGSFANDDMPGFRNILLKAGLSERGFFNLAVGLGALVGALALGLFVLVADVVSTSETRQTGISDLFALLVPLATLGMLIFFTSRLSRLTALINSAQKTESRLDKSVEIVSLSRMLEQEAIEIEARIDKFISAGKSIKQELQLEHAQLDTIFVDKISQIQNIIGHLDAGRRNFFADVDNVSKALEISRDFVNSRIGALTSDFESAALSAAKILETQIQEASARIAEILSKDFAERDLLEKLIESNEASLESIKEIPGVFHQQLQNAFATVNADLEKNVDRLASQIDTLSDSVARSNVDLAKNLSETPIQIAHYATTLHNDLQHTLELHNQKFFSQLGHINDHVDHFIGKLETAATNLPGQIERSLEIIEPHLERAFHDKVGAARQRLDEAIRPLLESNILINEALDATPQKLERYLERLAPIIDSRFAENALVIEGKITEIQNRQIEVGQNLIAQSRSEFDRLLNDLPVLEQRIGTTLQTNMNDLEVQIRSAEQSIATLFDSHKNTIEFSNRASLAEIEQSALVQLKTIGELIDKSWRDLENTILGSFSQQELRSKDFENSFRDLIADFKTARNDVSGVSSDLSGAIQTQFKSLENSIDVLLSRFNSSIVSNQDLAVKNISGQLTTTQQNLSNEYGLIEGRLFRSLNNFNEVVKNCIASLEEASNWRLKAFEEKIKSVSDENIDEVRKEFEQLADRMRLRIEELKADGSEFLAQSLPSTAELQSENDPHSWIGSETIDALSSKLETIDAILREIRNGSR